MMFSAFCPTHDSRVLMDRRNVLSFWTGPDGPVILWKCDCGHEGTLGRHGDEAAGAPADHPGCLVPNRDAA